MAKKRPGDLNKLREQNKQLVAENASLKKRLAKHSPVSWIGSAWRVLAITLLVGLAGALLMACNVLFWAGRTTLDTESYKQVSSQLIQDREVQSAVALYTTRQIFQNNDVSSIIQSVLPPQAGFLAEPLSARLEDYTQKTIAGILARPQFQERWVNVNTKIHSSVIKLANSPEGQDGVISLNEAYQSLTSNLTDTKLSFLAGKQLPASVGQIAVLESDKLQIIHILNSNLNTFKYASLGLVFAFSGGAVWLSRNRRRTVIVIGLVFSALMVATLLSLRAGSTILSSSAEPDYQAAIKHATDIVSRPLVIQTYSILLVSLVAAGIAYIGGPYKSAAKARSRIQLVLQGRAHQALFNQETSLTHWVGNHKQVLRVVALVCLVIYGLSVRLTPLTILVLIAVGLVFVILIEILAAPTKSTSKH